MKKALIVDNDLDFLDTHSELLATKGYEVFKAGNVEDAMQILDNTWVHVAIIDSRLIDDTDDKDTSGLALAKHEDYHHIPKIILTRFPSFEHVREVLGPVLEGLPPAVDFITKQDGSAVMFQTLDQVFARHVRINWELAIRWHDLYSFHHLITLIESHIDNTLLLERAAELEDLFRKLFYDHTQISIDNLFMHADGQIILEVFTYRYGGVRRQYIVSCGRKDRILTEDRLYDQLVSEWDGIGNTKKVKTLQTTHYAAITYTLTGGDFEEITTLRTFYQKHSSDEIVAALNYLFTVTLPPWHKQRRPLAGDRPPNNWVQSFLDSVPLTSLNHYLESICQATLVSGLGQIDHDLQTLTFYLADGSRAVYPNPASALADESIALQTPTPSGIVHGHISADTVLVNSKAQTWLIDFTHIGVGSLIHDFVSMEMLLRLDLLDTSDLHLRYDLEKRLLDVSNLSDSLPIRDAPSELQRTLAAIEDTRHLAMRLAGQEIAPYFKTLFFSAIQFIATFDTTLYYTRRKLIPYAHALVLTAMLTEKLTGVAQRKVQIPEQARISLWIDEQNKEVWVEGRPIKITAQDFKMLAFFYQHANQLCSRQQLVEEALDDEYNGPDSEENRINSALSRLRQKIEPDPRHPRYLKTVRGLGFKLVL